MSQSAKLTIAILIAPGLSGLAFSWLELGVLATPFTIAFVLLVAYSAALSIGRWILVEFLRRGRSVLLAAIVAGTASASLPILLLQQLLHALAAHDAQHWFAGLAESLVFPLQVGAYGACGGIVLWCTYRVADVFLPD